MNIDLNGLWDFTFRPDDTELPTQFSTQVVVPGCFDVLPEWADRRGVGYYRRRFEADGVSAYRLRIGGIAHNGSVYLDGRCLSEHHGAFTAVEIDLPDLSAGMHELIVAADNRLDGLNRPLHMGHFDWYSYGGIIRSVSLKRWHGCLIERVTPVVLDWRSGRVKVQVAYRSRAGEPPVVSISVDGVELTSATVAGQSGIYEVEISVPAPRPWSPESPHLHSLKVCLGDDEKEIGLGLRQVCVQGRDIMLNDVPVKIKGVNRHDCHVQFGFAIPPQLQLADVQTLKEMGCNFVRTSHYPPDPVFLELCDRLGMMVWCEATSWGYTEEMTTDPRMLSAQQQCIREMIEQYAHHPSIVMWGFFNECASDCSSARSVYENLVGLIRSLDDSRPVTFASYRCFVGPTRDEAKVVDLMLDLVDIISFNVYPGWYGGDLDDAVSWLDNLVQVMGEQGYAQKPMIVSEIGAGGLVGFDVQGKVKWSLSYQAELLQKVLSYIMSSDLLNGVCVWQYCDIRTSEQRWGDRPRSYNNKGVVDEYRRPKPAYYTVRDIFHGVGD